MARNFMEQATVPAGITLAILIGIGMYNMPGNRHGASKTPDVDTMPSYPVEQSHESFTLPPRGNSVSVWVCRNFVFVGYPEGEKPEVIVNPIVERTTQLPLRLAGVAGGIDLDEPKNYSRSVSYRINDEGQLEKRPLDACWGDVPVSTASVYTPNGAKRTILKDEATKVHDGEVVPEDPRAAVLTGIVHFRSTFSGGDESRLLQQMATEAAMVS